jgi:hypothetical protein
MAVQQHARILRESLVVKEFSPGCQSSARLFMVA